MFRRTAASARSGTRDPLCLGALGRLAAGAGTVAVLVTGALLTHEHWEPAAKALTTDEGGLDALSLFVIPLFWGAAGFLLWSLIIPAWQGHRWRRRVLGAGGLVGCAGALHWLSYEPEPGTGSYGVGVTVAVLLGTVAVAAVLAEAKTVRGQRALALACVAVAGVAAAWSVGIIPTATYRYTGDWVRDPGPASPRGEGRDFTYEVWSRVGPDRCGWQSAVFLSVGWPLGTTQGPGRPDTARLYVRDSDTVLPPATRAKFAGTLDTDSELPSGSMDTGYRSGDIQLLLGPDGGEQYIYLMDGRDVERWPRATEPPACARHGNAVTSRCCAGAGASRASRPVSRKGLRGRRPGNGASDDRNLQPEQLRKDLLQVAKCLVLGRVLALQDKEALVVAVDRSHPRHQVGARESPRSRDCCSSSQVGHPRRRSDAVNRCQPPSSLRTSGPANGIAGR